MLRHKSSLKLAIFYFTTLVIGGASSLAQATTIIVSADNGNVAEDGQCSIVEAIEAANTDTASGSSIGECVAGFGPDIIELTNDVTLTGAYETNVDFGSDGTPAFRSAVIVKGNNYTLRRDSNLGCDINGVNETGEFRLLRVAADGDLTLNAVKLLNGCADGLGGIPAGGGALLNQGNLIASQSTFANNMAAEGGAIENLVGGYIVRIDSSTLSANSAAGSGGALGNRHGSVGTLQNLTFSGNSAERGGAVFNVGNGLITLIENSTFANNLAAIEAGAIYTGGTVFLGEYGTIRSIRNTLFSSNGGNECALFNASSSSVIVNNLSDEPNGECSRYSDDILLGAVGPLNDNGGPSQTHAIYLGSNALDASDTNGTSSDQRGVPSSNVRDIGAFEAQLSDLCPVDLQIDGFTASIIDAKGLLEAIRCGNLNGNNNGGDTIQMAGNIILSDAVEGDPSLGRTGTPAITSAMVLDGQRHFLSRDNTLPCDIDSFTRPERFRLLHVASGGELDLRNIGFRHGCADSYSAGDNGGAILNEGTLSVDLAIFVDNSANEAGGAIANRGGLIRFIKNGFFSNNAAGNQGGAVSNEYGVISTIQDSEFTSNSAGSFGGAIMNYSGTIAAIRNDKFEGNSAQNGGAIETFDVIGTIEGSDFLDNAATFGDGGAIDVNIGSVASIQDSLFSNNTSKGSGGAISLYDSVAEKIQSVIFTANVANRGGGALSTYDSSMGAIDSSKFIDNVNTGLYGGAIQNNFRSTISTIQNSVFSGNSTTDGGGAIANTQSSTIANLKNSIFTQNSGLSGGAIRNQSSFITTIDASSFAENTAALTGGVITNNFPGRIGTIKNSTFANNSALEWGGVIRNSGGIVNTIENSTFFGNSAGGVGGVFSNLGTFRTIQNSTFANNSSPTGSVFYNSFSGVIDNARNILLNNNSSSECFNLGSIAGANNLAVDSTGGCPGVIGSLTSGALGALADNGGRTQTLSLVPGSQAIDSANGDGTPSDQRGVEAFNTRDIGAYELTPAPIITAPADILLDATSPLMAVDIGNASVVDDQDSALVAYPDNSGPFSPGVTTVIWTATDSSGNIGTVTQTVTIIDGSPIVTAPVDVQAEATGIETPVEIGIASANDLADGALVPVPDITGPFPLGENQVVWSATDSAGNTGTAVQKVTIFDTTPPAISIAGNNPFNLEVGGEFTDPGATAVDLVDGLTSVETRLEFGSRTDAEGTFLVTYIAYDLAGNWSSRTRTVNVGGVVPVRALEGIFSGGGVAVLSFTSTDPSCSFESEAQYLNESEVTPAPPPALSFINGVVNFAIEGCEAGASATITLDYGRNLDQSAQFWMSGDPWFSLPAMIGTNSVRYVITDGGIGDADGEVDGVITGQGGLAIVAAEIESIPIPSLSAIGLAVLSILMGTLGFIVLRIRSREG